MKCKNCNKVMDSAHLNTKYCSSTCLNKERYKRSGYRSTKEQRAEWRKNRLKNPGYAEKIRKQENERAHKIKTFLADYKIEKGCFDCGYRKHHSALDFDHVKGVKKLNVCFSKSIGMAKKEIKKCQVVCSNCHRIRTWEIIYPCKPNVFEMTYVEIKGELDEEINAESQGIVNQNRAH